MPRSTTPAAGRRRRRSASAHESLSLARFVLDFTFAIALTPAATAGDWSLTQALLGLTLASIAVQTEPDYKVLVAGHDRPALPNDPRISFVEVAWPVEPPGPHNDDSGRKKHLLSDLILEAGGGLMMIVDADDWVARDTVALARHHLSGPVVGGLIPAGEVVDLGTQRVVGLPHPKVFDAFHRICGTSTIARLRPDASDPAWRDPFAVLRSHHAWTERAAEHDLPLVELPIRAAYLIGTGINHSDVHGPHAAWRATFRADVNAAGHALDPTTAARYGLTPEMVAAVAAQVRT